MLGEVPDKAGFAGILLVATDAYCLNIHVVKQGFLEPFRSIGKEKGSVLMIMVAFLFSITSNLGKIAVQHSSPIFFSIFYLFLLSFSLSLIVRFKSKNILSKAVSHPWLFLFMGISMAIMMLTHLKAVSLVEVSYMISVKRLSLIIGVIYGALFFKEKNIKERILGSALMVSGIVMITVF